MGSKLSADGPAFVVYGLQSPVGRTRTTEEDDHCARRLCCRSACKLKICFAAVVVRLRFELRLYPHVEAQNLDILSWNVRVKAQANSAVVQSQHRNRKVRGVGF